MQTSHRHLVTDIQDLLDHAVSEGIAPAVSCAAVLGSEKLPVVTAGEASAQTYFDLASVTKLFTTVTALTLVDEGTLELDAPLGDALPAYKQGIKASVTLRNLLTHTSGLPAEWRGWAQIVAAGRPFERAQLVADLLATELAAGPGTRFEYSCAGFNTVMALAEHVTGKPWATLVQQRVLDKLVADATDATDATDAINATDAITGTPPPEHCAPTEFAPELGRGLIQGTVHDEAAWSLGGLSGNAGMFATAAGLAVFGEALRNGLAGILSPGLAAEMWRSQLPEILGTRFNPHDPGFAQGLGLRINQQPWMGVEGTNARGHGGFTGTSLLVDKTQNLTISLLSNRVSPSRDGDDATSLRKAVSDVVYSEA